jgi:hypothetical protein
MEHEKLQRWKPPTNVRDLIESSGSLSDSSITIGRSFDESSTGYEAIIHEPITKSGLYELLHSASPSDFSMSVEGILDDWYMPDRASGSETYARLLKTHESALGEPWKIFDQHRKLFIEVIGDTQKIPFQKLQGKHIKTKTGEDILREFFGRLNEPSNSRRINVKKKISRILEMLSLTEQSLALGEITKEFESKRRTKVKERSRYRDWNRTQLIGALQRVMESGIFNGELISRSQQELGYSKRTNPFTMQEEFVREYRSIFDNYQRGEQIQDGEISGTIELTPQDDGSLQIIISYSLEVHHPPFMQALLRWRKDRKSGKRTWIPEPFNSEELTEVIEVLEAHGAQTLPTVHPNTANPVAGLLAAIKLGAGRIVEQWPKKMGLPGGHYKQNMSEPQAPVLVIQQIQDIMENAPLIQVLEQYADIETE